MNKIIFSEKSSLSLKNKSLATCQYAAVFLKGILLFLLLAMFYLILLPVLAKAGLVPFHYEYTDNYHPTINIKSYMVKERSWLL